VGQATRRIGPECGQYVIEGDISVMMFSSHGRYRTETRAKSAEVSHDEPDPLHRLGQALDLVPHFGGGQSHALTVAG
jgi:hypothetical protein